MKKLAAGLLFVVLMSFGVDLVPQGSASAADPYPGSVDTTTTVKYRTHVLRKHHFSMKVTVTAAGNAPVTGLVSCSVHRNKGGYEFTGSATYNGSRVKIRTGKLHKKGRYSFTCSYKPPTSASVYKPSSASGSFKVRQPHRHHHHHH